MALSFNHMTRRIHDLVETVYKSELLEKDAELKALESQINPHFLYNTLATISWVARKAKAPDIVKLSDSMAKFYRLVLNKGNSETLVANELDMVGAYLAIQKFRFEDRFDAVFEVDEQVRNCYTLKNILQPLVENALIHGIEPKRSHGTIIIKAALENDLVVIRIIDDGQTGDWNGDHPFFYSQGDKIMFKMLIVEDERWEREGLVEFLDWESMGISVVETASDGIEGMDKALEMEPDIIITDIQMPGRSGIEMARLIMEQLRDVRIVVLTGYDDFEYAREALRFGAVDYVLKP
ncbi:hypothetical protein KC345_g11791, partial [Hortaea werneckii]